MITLKRTSRGIYLGINDEDSDKSKNSSNTAASEELVMNA